MAYAVNGGSPYKAARIIPNLVGRVEKRAGEAPEAFRQRVILSAQQYLRLRAGVPTQVPASYLADLWHEYVDIDTETAWLANRITVANVETVVELLLDAALDWYQASYYLTYGYGNLHVPRPREIDGIYVRLPTEVTALYRRDANLTICARVVDDFLTMFTLAESGFEVLSLLPDDENWRNLASRFDTMYEIISRDVLPLLLGSPDA